MLDIREIREFIEGIIDYEGIDRSKLLDGGAIYYMNGNDGTSFDYGCNNMTCEFYVFWKSEAGAIKLNQRGDSLIAYIYPEDDPFGGKYKKVEEESPFELRDLCRHLQGTFDDRNIWDRKIDNWTLTRTGDVGNDEEEEEWW